MRRRRNPAIRRGALRLLAVSCLLVAALITLLPGGSAAQEPSVVGWWHRDVPLSGDPGSDAASEAATVHAQSAGRPVVARLPGSPRSRSQVPPPPQLPPAPLPTTPPEVTVPDPGADLPTPSQAPEGGLLVAGDPSGARAMAALRFDAPDAGGAVLRLVISAGSTPSPGVQACPALSDWLPGPDQPWAHRPAHDCDRVASSSSLSADGTSMEWALPDTFKPADSPHYDVILVPISADGTPFQVAFDAPGPDAFAVTSPAPPAELPVVDPLPDDLPPPIDSFSADGFDVDGLGGPSFPGGGAGPADPVTVQPAGRTTEDPGPLGGLARSLENPTTRRIATLALAMLGAYAYWQSGQSVDRTPQLLGALRAPGAAAIRTLPATTPRGIGRFSRPRSEPPTRL